MTPDDEALKAVYETRKNTTPVEVSWQGSNPIAMTPDQTDEIRRRLQALMQWAMAQDIPAREVKEVVRQAFGFGTVNRANEIAALEKLGRLLREGNTNGNA